MACLGLVSAAEAQPSPARSVIKIILQFCKENGLTDSFNAIQASVADSEACGAQRTLGRRRLALLGPAEVL